MSAAILDIGDDVGALIVHAHPALAGREIEVSPQHNAARRTHAEVRRHTAGGRTVYAALFAALPEGRYCLWRDVMTDEEVVVTGGTVSEKDWRQVTAADDFRLALPEGLGDGRRGLPTAAQQSVLPARYQQGGTVDTTGMPAAPLCFGDDGQVAWDQMWSTFCDLALAGGPRHRPVLLEPAPAAAIAVQPDAYQAVVAQLERGLHLVSGLPTLGTVSPGWVGLQCDDEMMARWLLQAVAAENVSVWRQEATIYLPAGPEYRLETEIKSVVTVVAKSVHYWQEHQG
jgi:hypothetical protein